MNNISKNKSMIAGIGFYVPDKVLTNHDLEMMVETSDEWITTRTGIKERRIAAPEQATSDMSIIAAERAMKDANVTPDDIGLVVLATTTADSVLPSCASIVKHKLGIKNGGAFDCYAACSGFIYGLDIARQYVENNAVENVLVIGSEMLTRFTNWKDRSTCVLFGDGSGAAVVRKPRENENSEILSTYIDADGSYDDLLYCIAGGSRFPASHETVDKEQHYFQMNGSAVFKLAVEKMKLGMLVACEKAGIQSEQLDLVIPHQANIRIINSVGKYLKLPDEKVFVNVDKYGNTSSASIGIALREAIDAGKVKRGSLVGLVAFGGGMTWAASVIRY